MYSSQSGPSGLTVRPVKITGRARPRLGWTCCSCRPPIAALLVPTAAPSATPGAHMRVAACVVFICSVTFFLSCPCHLLPLNTTLRFCWLLLLPMSPSIPPLFPPPLPRRRLCRCPSCIDLPACITILLAASVCVVPFILLPMPPPPPIAFHDVTLELPLLIPPIPPPIPPIPPPIPPPLQPINCHILPLEHLIASLLAAAADVTIDPTVLSPASGLVASCCCLRLCCHLAATILF